MLDNTKITYINALQKASKENRLVVFAGAGTSADAGIPLWNELINKLSERLPTDIRKEVGNDNLQLAELYKEVSDDKDYYDGIEAALLNNAKSSNAIHDAVLSLNPNHIITTNYDTLFEDAALKNNRQYYVVATDGDLPRNHGEKLIVKMHGDLKHHNIILTESDYFDYSRLFPLVRSFVISQFVSKVVLFVGFSFNDPNLKFILREIRSELGDNMQHVYLLTDKIIPKIEDNYQFNKGINILSLNEEETEKELVRNKIKPCSDVSLGQQGEILVNQLFVIKYYRMHSDLMGMTIDFVKENKKELRSLGSAWSCLFPSYARSGFRRESNEIYLPQGYNEEFRTLFKNKESIRALLKKYGKDVDYVRKALIDDDIFSINDIAIRSKAYARVIQNNMLEDSVFHFYNLNQNEISKRISLLKARSLTYSIEDLELPYILFHTGHFYEAYLTYNNLAKEMWKNRRYALFFICIFNIHSVSRPAIREIKYKPGSETESIEKQYETIDLNVELNQLRLPDGVFKLFSDLINQKQLTNNVIEVNNTLQGIDTQRRGAERGTSWSSNSYIYKVIWNFISFLDFLTSNYIIMDNNNNGRIYYSTVTRCIVSSNIIPSSKNPYQTKLENLFRETLLIMVLNMNTEDLKSIYNDLCKEHELTADNSFKNQIKIYIDNLYSISSSANEIIEDKMLRPIFKNIILTCNVLKDCPKYEHLDELIANYWDRFNLQDITKEVSQLFTKIPPKGNVATRILSLISMKRMNEFELTDIANKISSVIRQEGLEWKDKNVLSYLEIQDSTDFAAIILTILPNTKQNDVRIWLKDHIKSLYQATTAEIYSKAGILNQENFDKYAITPFSEKDFRGKDLLSLYLSELYNDHENLQSKIKEFANHDINLQFYLDPINMYNNPNINQECFENISDEEIIELSAHKDALELMKRQANNSHWGGLFKNRLKKILWSI